MVIFVESKAVTGDVDVPRENPGGCGNGIEFGGAGLDLPGGELTGELPNGFLGGGRAEIDGHGASCRGRGCWSRSLRHGDHEQKRNSFR